MLFSEVELHAMRMGPGKHLKGRTLMGGIVKPEEVSISSMLECNATLRNSSDHSLITSTSSSSTKKSPVVGRVATVTVFRLGALSACPPCSTSVRPNSRRALCRRF